MSQVVEENERDPSGWESGERRRSTPEDARTFAKGPVACFSDACDQMILWRSFALWVRAIIKAEQALPDWLRDAIDQRCPSFFSSRQVQAGHNSFWVDLSAWVDEHQFSAARQGGWLDAVHFYSGRDPRAELVWDRWTRSESEWGARSPTAYPSFDDWHGEALANRAAPEEGAIRVRDYIEWEAFAFWARLMVEPAAQIPEQLLTAMERRCPGFAHQILGQRIEQGEFSTRLWNEMLAWIEDRYFADERSGGHLEALRAAARRHLRGERIAAYWADCSSKWNASPPDSYPDFEGWLRDADAFVTQ